MDSKTDFFGYGFIGLLWMPLYEPTRRTWGPTYLAGVLITSDDDEMIVG